jgi:hypothetical protein
VNTEKELVIDLNEGKETVLSQSGLLLEPSSEYTLSFQSNAEQEAQVTVQLTDKNTTTIYTEQSFNVGLQGGLNTLNFTMPDQVPEDGVTVRFLISGATVRLSDILLMKN